MNVNPRGETHVNAQQAAWSTAAWVRNTVASGAGVRGWLLVTTGGRARTLTIDDVADGDVWGASLASARLADGGRPDVVVAVIDAPGSHGFGEALVCVAAAGGGVFANRMPYRKVGTMSGPSFTWFEPDTVRLDGLRDVFEPVLPSLLRVAHPSGATPN